MSLELLGLHLYPKYFTGARTESEDITQSQAGLLNHSGVKEKNVSLTVVISCLIHAC